MHGASRMGRGSWARPSPRSLSMRGVRVGSRLPPVSMKRPVGLRDRRPVVSIPPRSRPMAPPPRSYERRAPGMHRFCLSGFMLLPFSLVIL